MELILSFIAGIIISNLFFLIYLRRIALEKGSFQKEKDLFIENKKNIYDKDQELERSKLNNAFLNGKEAGIIEEKNKLQVKITPVFEKEDGFFSSKLYVGYAEEVIYNGFSIGEPTYRHLKIYEKFKQENFEQITRMTFETINKIALNYLPNAGLKPIVNKQKELIEK